MSAEAWVGVAAILVTVLLAIASAAVALMFLTYRLALKAVAGLAAIRLLLRRFEEENATDHQVMWQKIDGHGKELREHDKRITIIEQRPSLA